MILNLVPINSAQYPRLAQPNSCLRCGSKHILKTTPAVLNTSFPLLLVNLISAVVQWCCRRLNIIQKLFTHFLTWWRQTRLKCCSEAETKLALKSIRNFLFVATVVAVDVAVDVATVDDHVVAVVAFFVVELDAEQKNKFRWCQSQLFPFNYPVFIIWWLCCSFHCCPAESFENYPGQPR